MEPEVRKRQFMIWYTVAAVFGVLLFQYFWELVDGKIAEVTVSTDAVEGKLKEPLPSGKRQFLRSALTPGLLISSHGNMSSSGVPRRATSFRLFSPGSFQSPFFTLSGCCSFDGLLSGKDLVAS